jgi:hypothetical protein
LRLLLVNPALPESFWSFRWALEEVLGGKRSLNPPLGLATRRSRALILASGVACEFHTVQTGI